MVETILTGLNIDFISQKSFNWLVYKKNMFLDFYIPSKNIAIECQGMQHFKSVSIYGGDEYFNEIRKRDKVKKQLCEEHGIRLLYFSNQAENNTTFLNDEIIKNKEKLIKIING